MTACYPRITQKELIEMFGLHMPPSVIKFLFVDAPADKLTLAEVRARLAEYAAEAKI